MVDPRTRSLVLNGNPGHLQFYSLQRDKLLYNVRLRKSPPPMQSGRQDHADRVFLNLPPPSTAGHRAAGVHPRAGSAAV